jgi:acylphosphatase
MIERRRYRVYGRVQGVGFRAYVWREARQLDLGGWVRNRFDGSVEVLAEGLPGEHDRLVQALEAGPRLSRVERVDSQVEAAGDPPLIGFNVLGDA